MIVPGTGYHPYGPEWAKELSKLSILQIEDIFGMKKNADETKKEFIQRIGEFKKRGQVQ